MNQGVASVRGVCGAQAMRLESSREIQVMADWRVRRSKPDEDIGFHLSMDSFLEREPTPTAWIRLS